VANFEGRRGERLGSAAGCLFTATGGTWAALLFLASVLGGGTSAAVASVLFGILLVGAPLCLILGGKLNRPGQVSAAYLGLVAVSWVVFVIVLG